MKLHRPIAENVIIALEQIFGEGYHADKVIERLFKNNRKLGSRDRRFIAETTYELVRWWRLSWAALGESEPCLERSALWKLLGAWLLLQDQSLPAWDDFKSLNKETLKKNLEHGRENPAIRESIPDWLYQLGQEELGERRWNSTLQALNEQAPVVLRANRLKTTREDLRKRLLDDEDIETEFAPATDDGLLLTERRNIFSVSAFQEGHFEVQDGASQQIGPLLDVQPGMRVIDACAGAGGKTLHLAAMMKNKGKIIAMDIHPRKLEELRRRCKRAGIDIVETKLIESSKTLKRLEKSADRLLLDVPCSGMGVLRRNPDAKWKLRPEDFSRLRSLQAEILSGYTSMLKPGGRFVYATCSILPSENEKQMAAFLAANPGKWNLLTERQFLPGENGYDGFYAAAAEYK